jgi:hypothetical protein
MKVKITNKSVQSANKAGAPYLDNQSRPYSRVGIQTEQHGKRWLSGFAYQGSPILNWKSGDEVEIEIEEKGQYLNFKLPKINQSNGSVGPMLEKIFAELRTINGKLDMLTIEPENEMPSHSDMPDEENNPPF